MDVAVVTGAGRGLGRAMAHRLARRGMAVLATDVDGAAAERVAAELGAPAWGRALDVRDPGALRAAAAEAADRGPLAVWVNNAGVYRPEFVADHADDEVRLMVDVNVTGVIDGCRAALARMDGGGRILNVASLAGLAQAPGTSVYVATKHAVVAFSISLQGELRSAGRPVEVRVLCPDVVDTPMVAEQFERPGIALTLSSPRMLTVDEVADRAIELLDGRRLVGVIPAWRGALARATYRFPRAGFAIVPLVRRAGERNRRRWRSR